MGEAKRRINEIAQLKKHVNKGNVITQRIKDHPSVFWFSITSMVIGTIAALITFYQEFLPSESIQSNIPLSKLISIKHMGGYQSPMVIEGNKVKWKIVIEIANLSNNILMLESIEPLIPPTMHEYELNDGKGRYFIMPDPENQKQLKMVREYPDSQLFSYNSEKDYQNELILTSYSPSTRKSIHNSHSLPYSISPGDKKILVLPLSFKAFDSKGRVIQLANMKDSNKFVAYLAGTRLAFDANGECRWIFRDLEFLLSISGNEYLTNVEKVLIGVVGCKVFIPLDDWHEPTDQERKLLNLPAKKSP